MKEPPIYAVVDNGTELRCIDAKTGALRNVYRYDGVLASGPIVTADRCTVVIKKINTNSGMVFTLPNFTLTATFAV